MLVKGITGTYAPPPNGFITTVLKCLSRSRQRLPLLLVLCVALAAALLAACDTSVDVLRPSEEAKYSFFGVLNVTADTQVIRVEPLGDSTQLGAPRDFDGSVVLENLDARTVIPLKDSLTLLGADRHLVHNFWTTHPIKPETRYQVRVEHDGETIASATTSTPGRPVLTHDSTFFLPCMPAGYDELRGSFANNRGENTFFVNIGNADRIASIRLTYPVTKQLERQSPNTFDFTAVAQKSDDGFCIPVYYREHLRQLYQGDSTRCLSRSEFRSNHARLTIATGGPDWPQWRGAPFNEVARLDTFSNVEGGHGVIGGVYADTMTVPILPRPQHYECVPGCDCTACTCSFVPLQSSAPSFLKPSCASPQPTLPPPS